MTGARRPSSGMTPAPASPTSPPPCAPAAGPAPSPSARSPHMTARHRWLMIGAGGMARSWVRRFLEPHRERIEVVGLVDVNPQALQQSGDFLQLPDERRFASMEAAFDAVEADCVSVCVPPAFHRRAIELAAERGWHVLSEKPMADTWGDSV